MMPGGRCPPDLERQANDKGVQLAATIVGGAPGRILVAYCQTGTLDSTMRKAARDLAPAYAAATAVCTAAGVLFPPLLIAAPITGALAAIMDTLGKGGSPSAGDVAKLAAAGASGARQLGAPEGEQAIAAAGALGASWDELAKTGAVPRRPSLLAATSEAGARGGRTAMARLKKAKAIAEAKARAKAKALVKNKEIQKQISIEKAKADAMAKAKAKNQEIQKGSGGDDGEGMPLALKVGIGLALLKVGAAVLG